MSIKPKITLDLSISKNGNTADECEDQFAISSNKEIIALSDGAADAAYSRDWSEMLVTAYSNQINDQMASTQVTRWIDSAFECWRDFESRIQSDRVPWFTLEKLKHGSAATFLGISFNVLRSNGNHLIWEATAYGDTCLFIVQEDLLSVRFPIETSDKFSNAPPLVRTISPFNPDVLMKRTGSVSCGDRCYLMTDALASWFLKSYELGDNPWSQFSTINDMSTFESFISQERFRSALRNDDVTLLIIEFEDCADDERVADI